MNSGLVFYLASQLPSDKCDFFPTVLEMLAIKPAADQQFDGVSLVPAFQGKPILRDAIFTYFPHNPPVPEWMPPAVSVHRGDWKLIRLFACGENGGDRWKLFNLRDDMGEKNDLVAKNPEIVKELDALIDTFLTDAGAVVPIANPAFEPTKYDIKQEGKPGGKHFGSKAKG